MNVMLLIPARGGSKGVTRKNLRTLAGIPLVGRAAATCVAAALRLPCEARVICSTEDPDVANAAREHGAEVPFERPMRLASDTSRSIDVVLHALNALGNVHDTVILVQPTSPLTHPDDLVGAFATHQRTGAPVVSVCENEHPIEWCFEADQTGRLAPIARRPPTHQRQAGSRTLRLNGAVYVASSTLLRTERSFLTHETRGYLMPEARSVDIDEELDFTIAEAILAASDTPTETRERSA